ncbi:MAG TPA: PQQ-dependent catabolism-associated CXXCW motif protein [Methylocystis sp.]|nr:PQQ-dependent catabolism-associated CXXCW motif protein [Methylocystis sp.]
MKKRLVILALSLVALAAPCGLAAARDGAPKEPAGYRMDDYLAPTPPTLQGAKVLTTQQAIELWKTKTAVFVDALIRPPKPANLPGNVVWRDPPRKDIPGSVWLANVGFGALAPSVQKYFEDGLARATGGDRTKTLVFYCRKNCWMSWNAAKRAISLGYSSVSWYPDGTDGWEAAKQPLEPREPEPQD